MAQHFDFLVIGSGIAGLSFALDVAPRGRVAILTKKDKAESNTNYAQGGIAAVLAADDSMDMHIADTLDAGAGLCDEAVVRTIVEDGPQRVQDLIARGMEFSSRSGTSDLAALDLGREGGHSRRRVVHAKDATGREIERALLAAVEAHPSITVLENHLAVDLITTEKLGYPGPNTCLGIYAFDRIAKGVQTFLAPVTVLATGGCGKVYLYTTNPDIATGDGVAMAYRAGARVANMEFIQFHPTCLYHPEARSFLISEAVRGEGAKLQDAAGASFMERFDERKELAPRDIVARAIDAEMKRTGADCVFLDIRHRGAEFIRERFPMIYSTCLKFGMDITRVPIPVVPAAHYQCGGVVAGVDGTTDIAGLFCLGEVACTGLHGANRLASNSLLEALVMAHRLFLRLQTHPPARINTGVPPWQEGSVTESDELVVVSHNWEEIRRLMWDYVGIVRTNKRLQRAASRLQNLEREVREFYWNFKLNSDLLELRNLVLIAQIIVESAMRRKESRGLHFNADYPVCEDPACAANTVLRRGEPMLTPLT
jgi:L-aspartate oxidase